MKKNKELIKALIVATIFWGVFFYVFSFDSVKFSDVSQWQWLFIGLAVMVTTLFFKLKGLNYDRDRSDSSWLSQLRNKNLSENMSALRDYSPIHPIAEEVNLEFLNASIPLELVKSLGDPNPALTLINPIRSKLSGDYLELFDEVLGTLAHPENQCPAYFESITDEALRFSLYENKAMEWCDKILATLEDSPMGQAVKAWRLKNNLTASHLEETLAWTRQEVRNNLVLRNHDSRSLLSHSLLVMMAAIKSSQIDKDPLNWSSFKRRYINVNRDDFIRDDPLILICALAHDIGKISAFKSETRDLSDHDQLGQRIVARLPSFFNSTFLSQEDRFILDNVLSKYHDPSRITVDLKLSAGQSLTSYSRSNRMHRILEILIKADRIAGLIEGRAAELRRSNKFPQFISEDAWNEILDPGEHEGIEDGENASDILPGDIGTFFREFIADPKIPFNTSKEEIANFCGFVQADIEFGKKYLYVDAKTFLEYLKEKVGYLPKDALELTSEALANEGLIHNPLSNQLNYIKSWLWTIQLYPREDVIHTRNDGIEFVDYPRIEALDAEKAGLEMGPLFMVDLEQVSEACDNKLKAYPGSWHLYAILVNSAGKGVTSPWKQGSQKLLEKRAEAKRLLIEGPDKDFAINPAEESKEGTPTSKPQVSSSNNKRASSKKKKLSSENCIDGMDDFLVRE